MSRNVGRTPRTEKGLRTPDNGVVGHIDFQRRMLSGVFLFERESIVSTIVAPAGSAPAFDVAGALSSVEAEYLRGDMRSQIEAVFPDLPRDRKGANDTMLLVP